MSRAVSGAAGLIGANGLAPAAMAEVASGEWLAWPRPGVVIRGASIDTRDLRAGQVFFAMRGDRVDGHGFVAEAAASGSPVVVVERAVSGLPDGVGVLCVADTRAALGRLATAYRESLGAVRVVGVTGSNGKTTTVRMVHSALRGGGLKGSHSAKSLNNALGLPLTLLGVDPGDDYVVCEIGTSRPGEIAALAAIARPDVSVITSIGMSHLEALGSVDGVAREKVELVRGVRPGGVGVVCAGSAPLERALAGIGVEVVRVGVGAGVTGLGTGADGSWCEVDGWPVRTRLPGAHNALNAALAFVVARRLGVSGDGAARGLFEAEPPPMRLEPVVIGAGAGAVAGAVRVVNDAYNANPDSMRATLAMFDAGLLDGVREAGAGGRRVAVIGEMLELGEHTGPAHDEIADLLARSTGVSAVMLVGSHALRMASRIEAARPGVVVLAEADAAADWVARASPLVSPGDIVLLKGSRGVRLERLVEGVRSRLMA